MDLRNKTIKYNTGYKIKLPYSIYPQREINDYGIVQFFYPDYVISDDLIQHCGYKVIYVGEKRKDLLVSLAEKTTGFINTVGKPDVDLDNRKNMLDFVYSKWGQNYTECVDFESLTYILSLDENQFINYIKSYWIIGTADLPSVEYRQHIQQLLDSLGNVDDCDIITRFVSLLEYYQPPQIERAIISYLDRCSKQPIGKFVKTKLALLLARYQKMNKSKKSKLLFLLLNLNRIARERGEAKC